MNNIDYADREKVIETFTYLCESHMDDESMREEFLEFAYCAKRDDGKYKALCKYMQNYARADGCFDPAMYEGDPYDMM